MADASGCSADLSGDGQRVYDTTYLLQCRLAMKDASPKPTEVSNLKLATSKVIPSNVEAETALSSANANAKSAIDGGPLNGGASCESNISCGNKEAVTSEATSIAMLNGGVEDVPDMLRHWAWWQVCTDVGDVVVRRELPLFSQEVTRIKPEAFLQQRGPARKFVEGQTCGLVRMPVQPLGWVTADAVEVGGPRYLKRAPVWQVIHTSGVPYGDVLMRKHEALDSDEVAILRCGDTVEQSGPERTLANGIVRMPVSIQSKNDGSSGGVEWDSPPPLAGWVTLDARPADGPLFFQPLVI